MTISSANFLLLCAITALATCCSCIRIELSHVDAKANITMAERFRRAGVRAHLRLESFGMAVPVTVGAGEYIAEFAIGSPPQEVHAMVDSMSNLVWTQCFTCRPNCFEQALDVYDYSLSSTARGVRCNESLCAEGYETQPCTGNDGRASACAIRTTTDFAADIAGVLREEEFTFGPAKANMAFGCITETSNIAALALDGASGVIGLGRGALSLVSQVGGNRRFSYCFTRHSTGNIQSSPLFVGPSAGLNGDAPFVSAPFMAHYEEPYQSMYYLELATVSVGEADLKLNTFYDGVILDSSFPFMILVDEVYKKLRKEMSRQLGSSLVASPVDWLELCVPHADVDRLVPPLVLHFTNGGGDWTIPAENYWAPVDAQTSCMVVLNSALAARPGMNRTSIIGNYMQQDMHVLYDLDNNEVSFQPADCSSI